MYFKKLLRIYVFVSNVAAYEGKNLHARHMSVIWAYPRDSDV